jgi:hypothetical protein
VPFSARSECTQRPGPPEGYPAFADPRPVRGGAKRRAAPKRRPSAAKRIIRAEVPKDTGPIHLQASFFRAAAARHALVLDDLAIKVVLRLDNAAKEHPAVHAGVGALEAGVVSLYAVVVILGRWVRVGCARLSDVHSSVPTFLWAGLRGALTPAGPFLI